MASMINALKHMEEFCFKSLPDSMSKIHFPKILTSLWQDLQQSALSCSDG